MGEILALILSLATHLDKPCLNYSSDVPLLPLNYVFNLCQIKATPLIQAQPQIAEVMQA